MASNLDFSTGVYLIYSYLGKTMIGKFYTKEGESRDVIDEVRDGLGCTEDCYYVANPAEIVFDLKVPASGSADLNWEIKPFFYHDLIGTNDTSYANIIVAYPKSEISLSNVTSTVINTVLLNAYRELCE